MPEYKSIEHASTVVVATNMMELAYLLDWCDQNNKHVAHFQALREVTDFPYCLSLDTEIVGWTDQMDRALYYKPFSEFLADTTNIATSGAALVEAVREATFKEAEQMGEVNLFNRNRGEIL